MFSEILNKWSDLGYTTIPSTSDKKSPMVKFKEFCGEDRREPSQFEKAQWVRDSVKETNALLLLASPKEDMPCLLVVDIDREVDIVEQWLYDQGLPETPLHVSTGRIGGGKHMYYIDGRDLVNGANGKNGCFGPPSLWEKRGPVDVKAGRAYVVAPENSHRSGLIYTASVEITKELIKSLPVMTEELFNKILIASTPIKNQQMKKVSVEKLKNNISIVSPVSVDSETAEIEQTRAYSDWTGIELSDGRNLLDLERGERCDCPFHSGRSKNTFLSTGTGRGLCFSYNCIARTHIHREVLSQGAIRLSSNSFLPDNLISFDREGLFVVKAPKGKGKTYQLARNVKDFDGRMIVLAPLRSLAEDQYNLFEQKLPHYTKDLGKGLISGSAVVVAASVERIDLSTPIDVLLIDEFSSILRLLTHTGVISPRSIKAVDVAFVALLQAAKTIIITDADVTSTEIKLLEKIRKEKANIKIYTAKRDETRSFYSDKMQLVKVLKQDIKDNKRAFVACTSKSFVDKISTTLRNEFPNKVITSITSENSSEILNGVNLDSFLTESKTDVLIVSPSLGTGFSINLTNYFTTRYGFYTASVMTAAKMDQLLARVRYPTDKNVNIWAEVGRQSIISSRTELRSQIMGKAVETESLLKDSSLPAGFFAGYDNEYTVIDDPVAAAYTDRYINQTFEDLWNGVCQPETAYRAYCDSEGIEVINIEKESSEETKKIRAEMQEAGRQNSEARAELISAAKPIDYDKAKSMKDVTQRERLEVERALVLEFYGDASPEMILKADSGKMTTKAILFASVMRNDFRNVLRELSDVGPLAARKYDYLLIKTIREMLQAASVLDESGINENEIDMNQLEEWFDKKGNKTFNLFGYNFTEKNTAMKRFSIVIKSIGLETKMVKKTKTSRTYQVNPSSVTFLLNLPGVKNLITPKTIKVIKVA
jgi:hypothetical protein